jgi:isohexenylglutaconyl-CoA hydratase
MSHPTLIRQERIGRHLRIILDDAPRRNALSGEMIDEIDAILNVSRDEGLASLIIEGANGVFSAGADLKSLAAALAQTPAPGEEDALQRTNRAGGEFFARLNAHPMATIAIVDGPAYGGGMGLACCADIMIATPRARFALSETGLGFPPAQIAPYLVARLGERAARRLALTGARLDGQQAAAIGLVDFFCADEAERDALIETLLNDIGRCAPGANAVAKRLILEARYGAGPSYIDDAARSFAQCLRGGEGREGVASFVEKRAPSWAQRVKWPRDSQIS